jgi:hypothetical protein
MSLALQNRRWPLLRLTRMRDRGLQTLLQRAF